MANCTGKNFTIEVLTFSSISNPFSHDRPIWFCIWMLPELSYLIQKWKRGYGNVCDEPGETWPGLASTFTQKRINLFNHPELPLCIPDEAVGAKLCLLGAACHLQVPKYAWEGGRKPCGDILTPLLVACLDLNSLQKVVHHTAFGIFSALW